MSLGKSRDLPAEIVPLVAHAGQRESRLKSRIADLESACAGLQQRLTLEQSEHAETRRLLDEQLTAAERRQCALTDELRRARHVCGEGTA